VFSHCVVGAYDANTSLNTNRALTRKPAALARRALA
jgi:hypothetical protein